MAFVLQLQGVLVATCHTSHRQALTTTVFLFVIPQGEKPASQKEPTTRYTVKLRGAPFNVTEVGRVGVPGSGKVRS